MLYIFIFSVSSSPLKLFLSKDHLLSFPVCWRLRTFHLWPLKHSSSSWAITLSNFNSSWRRFLKKWKLYQFGVLNVISITLNSKELEAIPPIHFNNITINNKDSIEYPLLIGSKRKPYYLDIWWKSKEWYSAYNIYFKLTAILYCKTIKTLIKIRIKNMIGLRITF